MEELNACVDDHSSLNYLYAEVCGGEEQGELPVEFSLLPPEIYDQGAIHVMRMSCTRCSPKHCVDAQNKHVADVVRGTFKPIDVEAMWRAAIAEDPTRESRGDAIRAGLDQFVKDMHLSGYSEIRGVDEAKRAIYAMRPIATGSANGNWTTVRESGVYGLRSDGKTVGHAWCMVGWNEVGFVCINSYGPDNGVFVLPYALFDTTFTKYAVHDVRDAQTILDYKKRTMDGIKIDDAKKALEANVWNGERPQDTVTREEAAAMVYRATLKTNG